MADNNTAISETCEQKYSNCIFNNCCTSSKENEYSKMCDFISRGLYMEVISQENINKVLGIETVSSIENWQKHITDFVAEYLGKSENKFERQHRVLSIGITCLQLFVQLNWVGPPVKWNESMLFPPSYQNSDNKWNLYIHSLLEIDGEPVYHLVTFPSLLVVAKTILSNDSLTLPIARVWLLRSLRIHQELLQEKSQTLRDNIEEIIREICNLISESESKVFPPELQIQLYVEFAHLMYFYYKPDLAATYINKAKLLSGLDIELSGALGKRTRFQVKEISQLLLRVSRKGESLVSDCDNNILNTLPKNIPLDDDTVLESIDFNKEDNKEDLQISTVEQALILGLLYHHRKTHEGIGDILKEESLAYINYILEKPMCWAVQTRALFLRCQWEQESSRRLQRCLSQAEELVNQYKRPEPTHRMHLLHSVQLLPKWYIERELAELFMNLNMNASALEVYLRLEMWEEVIKCYASLGRKEKAENVIRAQLEITETPTLYCYLGDVTNDPQYYVKAWELSDGRNSRSQRCLAFYYLRKMEFAESLPHFQKTLAINSLQVGVWFSYGCAALACEDFNLASKAFNRCVTLEPDNFESWNNLATSYVRSNQKSRAFIALQEAVKCEFENWKLWENMLVIGSDIGEFAEVIRAYHRLLDLRDKYADAEVLKILVRAVNENILDVNEKPSSGLRPKLQELFGRLTSKVTTDGSIWLLYAELIQGKAELSQQDREKALQYLQKSHRCHTQKLGWEKDIEKCKEVGNQCLSTAKAHMEYCNIGEIEPTVAIQNLSSARLMLKGVLVKIRNKHTDPVTQEVNTEVKDLCSDIEQSLSLVENSIASKKGN